MHFMWKCLEMNFIQFFIHWIWHHKKRKTPWINSKIVYTLLIPVPVSINRFECFIHSWSQMVFFFCIACKPPSVCHNKEKKNENKLNSNAIQINKIYKSLTLNLNQIFDSSFWAIQIMISIRFHQFHISILSIYTHTHTKHL